MTDIDLSEDLGDAQEVYDTEITAESTFRLDGPVAMARQEDIDATWRVDEVYGGMVAFTGFHETEETKGAGFAQFTPGQAERLGLALLRASEYAKDQALRQ